MKKKKVITEIRRIFKENASEIDTTHLYNALGIVGGKKAVKAIMSLYAVDSEMLTRVIEALGAAGGKHAIQELLAMEKAHPDNRHQIIVALANAATR